MAPGPIVGYGVNGDPLHEAARVTGVDCRVCGSTLRMVQELLVAKPTFHGSYLRAMEPDR